ncbi:MAG TPA: thiamine diphosphokinase [Spirochaetaceae bacterium]|nr:thiamine diphosphokinase [Spirochaetaceae bacterium]
MSKAHLVCGGLAPPYAAIKALAATCACLCAADSGLDSLHAWGLKPDLIVGDMDSLSSRKLLDGYRRAGVDILEQDTYKDDTDTETGLRILRQRGHDWIAIAGGGGGRLDHLLAIRALFERPDGPAEWYTDRERVIKLERATILRPGKGQLVSVFPLGGAGASGMASRGLEWPLNGLVWPAGGFGISNLSTADTVSIDPGPQPLLVIVPLAGC